MGQGSSIMMWWLRRAINCFELAACLLCCCSQGCSHGELRTCSISGEAVYGVWGQTPTPLSRGTVRRTGDPHHDSVFREHRVSICRGNASVPPAWPALGRFIFPFVPDVFFAEHRQTPPNMFSAHAGAHGSHHRLTCTHLLSQGLISG